MLPLLLSPNSAWHNISLLPSLLLLLPTPRFAAPLPPVVASVAPVFSAHCGAPSFLISLYCHNCIPDSHQSMALLRVVNSLDCFPPVIYLSRVSVASIGDRSIAFCA
jgi:hypothetical protein